MPGEKGYSTVFRGFFFSIQAGTAAEGLYWLKERGFETAIAKAVRSAYLRSVELGKA